MMKRKTFEKRIIFKNSEVFGNFCATLSEEHVHFRHAGFFSIIISTQNLKSLPQRSCKMLKDAGDSVEISYFEKTGERARLPTRDEAEKLLSEFARKH